MIQQQCSTEHSSTDRDVIMPVRADSAFPVRCHHHHHGWVDIGAAGTHVGCQSIPCRWPKVKKELPFSSPAVSFRVTYEVDCNRPQPFTADGARRAGTSVRADLRTKGKKVCTSYAIW
ncbi:hypothetical protein K504DRAFT_96225 [Pleomassaria siparia CBS 279.74]|uniref:Uncharacterized protein n=1 Tax=Pleomassaria siparia CBS 279.74 TaxID=1314801 RepID=A0A6G1JXV1_9PLEO|nr:hypothetical protein K504DRAFT_96225 [Pleomassaria siparia CBS 279.74]